MRSLLAALVLATIVGCLSPDPKPSRPTHWVVTLYLGTVVVDQWIAEDEPNSYANNGFVRFTQLDTHKKVAIRGTVVIEEMK